MAFKDLDETFDIVPSEVTPIEKPKTPKVSSKSEDREKDYNYVRAQLYNIVEKMQQSIDGAMETAEQTNHPRAYEVAMNGAKNAADVVEKISDLHKKMKELEVEEVRVQQNNTTNNNVFMSGSTAELMQLLKENKNK